MRHASIFFILCNIAICANAADAPTPEMLAHPPSQPKENKGGWPEGSAMDIGGKAVIRRDRILKELGDTHEKLKTLVAQLTSSNTIYERLNSAIVEEQKSWLAYYGTQCMIYGVLNGGMSPWQSARQVQCMGDLASIRLRKLNSVTKCIEHPIKKEDSGVMCLKPLSPLKIEEY